MAELQEWEANGGGRHWRFKIEKRQTICLFAGQDKTAGPGIDCWARFSGMGHYVFNFSVQFE